MASTIWKGTIELGSAQVPVRFYAAVQEQTVHFNLLHAKDKARVSQRMVNPDTGDVVPPQRIRKGYEVEKGVFVTLADDELDELTPAESRTIAIDSFVPNRAINHQWYERPYFLGPDGNEEDYFALVAALQGNELEGVARWVMRKRNYIGSLQVSNGHLLMVTLRFADEVISAASLPRPQGRALERQELQMAEQLVTAMQGRFEPSAYRDEYRQRLQKFLQAKAAGLKPRLRLVKPPRVRPADDLAAVLAASLRSLKKERLSA